MASAWETDSVMNVLLGVVAQTARASMATRSCFASAVWSRSSVNWRMRRCVRNNGVVVVGWCLCLSVCLVYDSTTGTTMGVCCASRAMAVTPD